MLERVARRARRSCGRSAAGGRATPSHAGFAAIYYWIMRRVVGMKEMPARGADFFLIDRAVIDAFRQFPERNVSVLALITWLGFRQESIEYDKQPRAAGRSGWTLARKIKLVVDSVDGVLGRSRSASARTRASILLLAGLLVGVGALVAPAVSSLRRLLLLLAPSIGLAGVQLLALGIVGEYVWRALDEARRRPQYVIEAAAAGSRRPCEHETGDALADTA